MNVVLWRRFNDVTVHNNTDVLLHDSNQKPPSTIVHTSTKKQESNSSSRRTNYPKLIVHRSHMWRTQSLRLIRTCVGYYRHRRCCCCCRCRFWTFLHTRLLSLSVTLVMPLLAHFVFHFSVSLFHLLELMCKFLFPFLVVFFFFFHFCLSLCHPLIISLLLACSFSLSFSTQLCTDYIKYTYDRQLYNTYKHQHSCLMYGSGLLLYLVQFSSIQFGSACKLGWYLCLVFTIPICVLVHTYTCVRMCVLICMSACLHSHTLYECMYVCGVVHSALYV